MNEKHGQLARIAIDLGREQPDEGKTHRKPWWRRPRRSDPDFCARYAAEGLQQLERYLAACPKD